MLAENMSAQHIQGAGDVIAAKTKVNADIPAICQPTLSGYKWAITSIEEFIISDGFTLRLGVASVLIKRSISVRLEKLHAELAGTDAVDLGAEKRLGVLVRRLDVWMKAINKPWPYWKTLFGASPTILTYIWLHAIKDAPWRDQAIAWVPVEFILNYIILYFPFLDGWKLSRAALAGFGGRTASAEKATFSRLGISVPKDRPLHLYFFWLVMVGANMSFTWIASGQMVEWMMRANGANEAPVKMPGGSELVEPSHFWQVASVQVIWLVVAVITYRWVRKAGSDEEALAALLAAEER